MAKQSDRTHIKNLMWDSCEEALKVAAECVCGRCDGELYVVSGEMFSARSGWSLKGWWLTLCSTGHVHNGVRVRELIPKA